MSESKLEALVVSEAVVIVERPTYHLGSEKELEKAAADAGCVIVRPEPNELFLDIDKAEDMAAYLRNSAILRRFYSFNSTIQPSKSGGAHAHVYLKFERTFTPTERVMLQAFLGSDRTREILGWLRIDQGSPQPPTVFFEKIP